VILILNIFDFDTPDPDSYILLTDLPHRVWSSFFYFSMGWVGLRLTVAW